MKNHVVCLSTTNYHPLPTRKQNVMSRLRNSEVLYFDPPVSIIAPLKDKKASAYISKYRQPGEKVEGHENITVYALPPVLPFFNKFRWVNRAQPEASGGFRAQKDAESTASETRPCCGAIRRPPATSSSRCRTAVWSMTAWAPPFGLQGPHYARGRGRHGARPCEAGGSGVRRRRSVSRRRSKTRSTRPRR